MFDLKITAFGNLFKGSSCKIEYYKMKIAFFGSNLTGKRGLEELINLDQEIAGIFTIPRSFNISYSEKPVRISRAVPPNAFEDISRSLRIPLVYVSDGIKEEHVQLLGSMNPDMILASGWYYMIPKRMRGLADYVLILHPSLLPKYRGGAPLTWAIINGEEKTGITLFHCGKETDAGDIVSQKEVVIEDDDDIGTLYNKIDEAALEILRESIPLLEEGTVPRIPQDHSQATYFPQRKPEDGLIDWNKTPRENYNCIRAQTRPYPGAFTFYKMDKIYIWSSKCLEGNTKGDAGEIVETNPLVVSSGEGLLRLLEIECEAKTKLKLKVGDKFSNERN